MFQPVIEKPHRKWPCACHRVRAPGKIREQDRWALVWTPSSGWKGTSSRVASAAATQRKSHFFSSFLLAAPWTIVTLWILLLLNAHSWKNGHQGILKRPGLKVTLTSPAQEGQDGDKQLEPAGAAFSLTLGLLNDTWELTPLGPREQSHKWQPLPPPSQVDKLRVSPRISHAETPFKDSTSNI